MCNLGNTDKLKITNYPTYIYFTSFDRNIIQDIDIIDVDDSVYLVYKYDDEIVESLLHVLAYHASSKW